MHSLLFMVNNVFHLFNIIPDFNYPLSIQCLLWILRFSSFYPKYLGKYGINNKNRFRNRECNLKWDFTIKTHFVKKFLDIRRIKNSFKLWNVPKECRLITKIMTQNQSFGLRTVVFQYIGRFWKSVKMVLVK